MKIIKPKNFTPKNAWDSLSIANMNGITTKLHWTDKPYIWHTNDGDEVFVVLDGSVKMHYKENDKKRFIILNTSEIFYANIGCEHYAEPMGIARILVIENQGSI